MNTPSDPTGSRRQAPVGRYALILGVLVIAAVVFAVIYGQKNENARPAGSLSSPPAHASTGPSPRY